ncbi:hypothetical protein INS49_014649 [Diaporthe citri]|uniref:uncharacterized protein n=1 Tax=Diaporthe citri TaxID=83186 RepID=UPI001C80B548|nr:uncharacterized protein INS49_014649 [Diaporthe citri]KAG6356775.1 hypothetical protein INS49_014649 [Diaporthe citri]
MYFTKSYAAAAVFGLATITEAHILMASPVRATTPAVTNGPLLADGSNYPCQLTSGQTLAGESTSMELGSDQPLNFIGESVHGGGSCQVSITYDENPTADSVWKTVTSIEGGCPAQNAEGNLGDDTSATKPIPYDYNFTIPDNIPTGKAVVAWTWFNKVGNREMYMNCALVELTGTSGDKSNFEALPDMFKANIDSGGCSTPADTDLVFPDPGENLHKLNGATTAWGSPVGSCATGSSSQPTGGSGAGTGASVTGAAGSAPTSSAAASEASPPAGGIFATVSTGAGATSAPAAPAPTGSGSTGSGSSGSSGSSGPGSSSSSGSASAGSACTTEGDYQCVSSTSYQVCASGTWSAVMPVAAGTSCSGTGANFEIVAAASKFKMTRALRRAKRGLPFFG